MFFWLKLHEKLRLPWQHQSDEHTIDMSKFPPRINGQLLKVSAPLSKTGCTCFQKFSGREGATPPPTLVCPRKLLTKKYIKQSQYIGRELKTIVRAFVEVSVKDRKQYQMDTCIICRQYTCTCTCRTSVTQTLLH